MQLRFLPKDTWMVARIGTQLESVSIHATKEEAFGECARKNAGDGGLYCALITMGGSASEVANAASSIDLERD
jgi:hypothetical protein